MTALYAGTNPNEANDFANFHALRGATVVKVDKTDAVQFFKGGKAEPEWYSGTNADWIVVFATYDDAVVKASPRQPAD
jgi:hypothetical protein